MTKILIVDDEPTWLSFLREDLENWGYQVTQAYDGKRALEILMPDGTLDKAFAAVISDCKMSGSSGLEFLQALQESRVTVPFLLHSSSGTFWQNEREIKLWDIPKIFPFAKFCLKPSDMNFDYADKFLQERGITA